ncbi:carbamoyltransferase HypF [Marinobacterium litorale]|uniref:carbamoyltransferase HypF n=1 Tax=Marinobacterium litorale TaxID=404770 RepID=UPI000409B299|nr:carbamoyltransferase HypF [Marinobacterium litorale]
MPAVRLLVSGQVQGVGFRPFVHRLATGLALKGAVSNGHQGVQIDLQGEDDALACFRRSLERELPALARIDQVRETPLEPGEPFTDFRIIASEHSDRPLDLPVTPDAAVCHDCLRELFDPLDRRYRYPFINCTHCGPRYSLIRALPYDRPNTSMAAFKQCAACEQEYQAPEHRRFHAQPNACPSCGPRLWAADNRGAPVEGDPIVMAVAAIQRGEILAVRGVGGFHLVCDATNAAAVRKLRERKCRPSKPFAIMGLNAPSLAIQVEVTANGLALLRSSIAPIVLQRRLKGSGLPDALAPGLDRLGVMLPHTPLHWLLFHEAAQRPGGVDWLAQPHSMLLVMTSANRSGEPLITANDEALCKLGGIADLFLLHDREIEHRCDDSLFNALSEPAMPIRLGRGAAPLALSLPERGPSVLALGAYLKNTLCLTQGARAYLSHHVGDLDNADNCRTLERTVDQLCDLLSVRPGHIACDLHPDFHASRYAQRLSEHWGVPLHPVQHHHAHVAAVMAEHGHCEPVLGVALDGVGLGWDGLLRGGELLRVDRQGFKPLAALTPLPLPGGDAAAREPWRMAVAVLYRLGRHDLIDQRYADCAAIQPVLKMLERGVNCPPTTSLGRAFDAAAGLLGICERQSYEAHAPMLLEALANSRGFQTEQQRGALIQATDLRGDLDLLPLFASLLEATDPAEGARAFHAGLVTLLSAWIARHAEHEGLNTVALSGGCLLNLYLRDGLRERLSQQGFSVLLPEKVPANDAAISLGQAWVVQMRLDRGQLLNN